MNEEKTNKYISAVVYFSVKRRKIKYVEIEHKYDYINMEKFHEKIIGSLNQQYVFNRGKNPTYASKMKTTMNVVRKRLGKKDV